MHPCVVGFGRGFPTTHSRRSQGVVEEADHAPFAFTATGAEPATWPDSGSLQIVLGCFAAR